jgi:hypothetical protein
VILEPVRHAEQRRDDSQNENEHDRRATMEQEREFGGHREHLLPSEAEVLERFGRLAVQPRRAALVTAPCGEVALGDPRSRAV